VPNFVENSAFTPSATPSDCSKPPLEAELLTILTAKAFGEAIEVGFRRKELELKGVFARLGIEEATALHRRLCASSDGDELATQFGRLSSERRERLLSFLGDARRRASSQPNHT